MWEDRAILITYSSGSTRWGILRDDEKIELMDPVSPSDLESHSKLHREWLWRWARQGLDKDFYGRRFRAWPDDIHS